MRAQRLWVGLVFCVVFARASTVQAQVAAIVEDPLNLIQNTLQVLGTAEIIVNQIFELIGLDELVLGEDLSGELDTLAALGTEANGLITDLASIQRAVIVLFDLETAPRSASALRERLAEIRRLVWKAYRDALAVQTILQSSVSALRHIIRLVEGVSDLLGNNQSNQTLIQLETKLTVELIKLKEHTIAFHRAQILDHLTDPLIAESMDVIQDELLLDYPGAVPGGIFAR